MAQAPAADPLRPFGRLSKPMWTAASMAFAKDAAALNELRRRGPGQQEEERPPAKKGDPKKGDPKGQGRGKAEGGGE